MQATFLSANEMCLNVNTFSKTGSKCFLTRPTEIPKRNLHSRKHVIDFRNLIYVIELSMSTLHAHVPYQALLLQTAQLFLKMLRRMIIQQCYNTTRSMFKFVVFHSSYFPHNSVDAISSCRRLHTEEHKSFLRFFKS